MADPTGKLGNHTVVKRAGTKIAWKIRDISGPSIKSSVIDATNFDSTFKEKIFGLPDVGPMTLEVEHNGTYPTLNTLEATVIEWNDGGTTTGSAAITEYTPKAPLDGVMTATMVLEFTGELTHAAGS